MLANCEVYTRTQNATFCSTVAMTLKSPNFNPSEPASSPTHTKHSFTHLPHSPQTLTIPHDSLRPTHLIQPNTHGPAMCLQLLHLGKLHHGTADIPQPLLGKLRAGDVLDVRGQVDARVLSCIAVGGKGVVDAGAVICECGQSCILGVC